MGQYSDKFRVGPGFAWFRSAPSKTNGKPTLASQYTAAATAPDPLLANLLWPVNGRYLGPTVKGTNIDINPNFKETDLPFGLMNVPTDSILQDQSYDISMQLAYNNVDEIADLFRLPENESGGNRSNTRDPKPYEGSLLIALSNILNSDPNLHHIVKMEFYYRVQVVPTRLSITGGKAGIQANFKVLAAKGDDGCYLPRDYVRWTTSIYNPNTTLLSNGQPMNTDVQIPYPISTQMFIDL